MENGKHHADFQRLESLKNFLGITYQEMAAQTGIKSPNSFYAVKSGKQGISKRMAAAIVARYPEISEAWLVSGRGSMLIGETHDENRPQNSGDTVTIEKRVLDTIISQQETIRMQAETIRDMAGQRGNVVVHQAEDATSAAVG